MKILFSTWCINNTCKKDENATKIWYDGMYKAISRINPSRVLAYGGDIDYKYPDGIEVRDYYNKAFKEK